MVHLVLGQGEVAEEVQRSGEEVGEVDHHVMEEVEVLVSAVRS